MCDDGWIAAALKELTERLSIQALLLEQLEEYCETLALRLTALEPPP